MALLIGAVVLGVVGAGLVFVGTSNLEAEWINVGTLLGRESGGPRVGTTSTGTVMLLVALASLVAGIQAILGERQTETRRRP